MSSDDRLGAAGTETAPLLILAGIATGFVLFTGAWLGGTLGVLLAGGGWRRPPFGFSTLAALLFRGGPAAVWPGHATAAVAGMSVLGVLLLVAAAAGVWWWLRRWPRRGGLASGRDLAALGPKATRARAHQLRPSLRGRRQVRDDETGVLIGELDTPGRQQVRFSFEDTFVAFMAPRAGKTTALTVPAILSAPGPVIATSNKSDVYTATVSVQARRGPVWTFDPQNILHLPQQCWWDMISSAATIEGATRLAGHFITATLDAPSRGDFFAGSARRLLTALFHAAAISGRQVDDVLEWLATPGDRTPTEVLRERGLAAMARSLDKTTKVVPETRDGIYETAQHAVTCLLDPQITAWVTPARQLPQFDPHAFAHSTDTLYLLSKDGGAGAAPVIAALVDAVLQAGMAAGERAGGRLDPPLLAALDEAANICKIEDLPHLYSHLGSRGVIPMTILQSWPQGVTVWGEHPFEALWSASTAKLVGAGVDDADFAERISRLIGEHHVRETSVSHGTTGRSVSTSRRKERIMDAGAVRALPRGTALLLATGLPVGRVRLLPWYDGPNASSIDDARRAVEEKITQRARLEEPGGPR